VDGTGPGSCPVAGFCVSGVEPSRFLTRELAMWVREGRHIELLHGLLPSLLRLTTFRL
jgi:hypothetical protein